jgi:tetratricopeptide (TPR) repeat protein
MGDDAAAEKHLTAACASDPRNADAFARLGELYVASDRDDVAMRAFTVAVELVEREEEGKERSGDEGPRVGGAVDSSLLATKAAALAGMASIYEKHGQPGRAYETYERMDDADPRVANRKREILTAAAVKLQRVFRGNKAREAMRKAARGRVARRQYGAVLAPRPIHNRGEGSGVVLADSGARLGGVGAFAWAQMPLARDGGRENRARGAGGFKTLGSSFF